MAHNVETMAYFGATPWHGLGETLEESDRYDLDSSLVKSGLNWTVEKVQLKTSDTDILVDSYAVRRVSDGSILGTVGPKYHLLQNIDAFRWFEPFLQARTASLNTAGALCGGSRVWVLAKIESDPVEIVKNDIVEKYLLLSHAHDGSLAVRVGFTPIRVVCANTLAMAHDSSASKLIRLKHSRNLHTNLENVREIMQLADQEFVATAEQYSLLARRDINQKDLRKYVKLVLCGDEDKKLSQRSLNIIQQVTGFFESGRGNDQPGVRGTYWAAYNAVTEYLSWEVGRDANNRLNSLWFGQNGSKNKRALEIAVEMVAV